MQSFAGENEDSLKRVKGRPYWALLATPLLGLNGQAPTDMSLNTTKKPEPQ